MHWDVYTVFSVISGVACVGLALSPGAEARTRVLGLLSGVAMAGYGWYVAGQTSGTYYFPVQVFLLPPIAIGLLLWQVVTSARARRAPRADASAARSDRRLAPTGAQPPFDGGALDPQAPSDVLRRSDPAAEGSALMGPAAVAEPGRPWAAALLALAVVLLLPSLAVVGDLPHPLFALKVETVHVGSVVVLVSLAFVMWTAWRRDLRDRSARPDVSSALLSAEGVLAAPAGRKRLWALVGCYAIALVGSMVWLMRSGDVGFSVRELLYPAKIGFITDSQGAVLSNTFTSTFRWSHFAVLCLIGALVAGRRDLSTSQVTGRLIAVAAVALVLFMGFFTLDPIS